MAVTLLFELSRPDPTARRPLFTDFAPPQLLISHPPNEVKVAHAPLVALFAELMIEAAEAGELREDANPRRIAAMTMQTIMFIAQSSSVEDEENVHTPISGDEVWTFCSQGFARK